MRVNSDVEPITVLIEPYMSIAGYVEVRIRENVSSFNTEEGLMYEYDEYVFHVPDKPELFDEISNNLNDWLATGRSLEVNENASMVQDMKQALSILGVSMNE